MTEDEVRALDAKVARYKDEFLATQKTFAGQLELVLEGFLSSRHIPGDVEARPKLIPSFAEKVGRKGYKDPFRQMTDLCGARVIVYQEDHVDPVCDVIRSDLAT